MIEYKLGNVLIFQVSFNIKSLQLIFATSIVI